MPWRFVLTGTRGCGFGDIASILGDAGIPCYTYAKGEGLTFDDALSANYAAPAGQGYGVYSPYIAALAIEASKRVSQRLVYDSLICDQTVFVHVVRNPWTVLASLVDYANGKPYSQCLTVNEKVALLAMGIDLDDIHCPIESALTYYVSWHWLTSEAWKRATLRLRWQYERLTTEDLAMLAGLAGYAAYAAVPVSLHTPIRVRRYTCKNELLMKEFSTIRGELGYD